MEPQKFTLKDKKGEPHHYEARPLPAGQATEICQHLLADASPMVVEFFLAMQDNKDVKDLDMSSVLPQAIRSLTPKMQKQLFSYCTRDDKDLGNDLVYNEAYTGNLGEMILALGKLVEISDLLPLFAILEGLQEAAN